MDFAAITNAASAVNLSRSRLENAVSNAEFEKNDLSAKLDEMSTVLLNQGITSSFQATPEGGPTYVFIIKKGKLRTLDVLPSYQDITST